MKKAFLNRLKIFDLNLFFESKVRLFLLSCLWPFLKKINCSIFKFRINFKDGSLFIFDLVDLGTFFEIFVFEEYFIKTHHSKIKRVLDIGANRGFSSIYFAQKFINAQIIAVEADPANGVKLKINANLFSPSRILIEELALSDREGSIDFYLNFKTNISGSTLARDLKAEKILVPTTTLVCLEKKYGFFDVIKFDIEGGEWESVYPNLLEHKPFFCIGEYHEDLTGKSLQDFLDRFDGYKLIFSKRISKSRSLVILQNNNL